MSREAEPAQAAHVILMRRADTDAGFRGDERERPLSAQGKLAARNSSDEIFGEGHHPGPLLVSTSLAARQTAQIMVAELHVRDEVIYSDLLYQARADVMEAQVRAQAVAYTLVTLIADNPGISELARFLASNPNAPDMRPAEWRYLPWGPRG